MSVRPTPSWWLVAAPLALTGCAADWSVPHATTSSSVGSAEGAGANGSGGEGGAGANGSGGAGGAGANGSGGLGGANGPGVDASGSYQLTVTNGPNGCNFWFWVQGAESMDVPLDVAQVDVAITASAGGDIGDFADFWLGSHVFSGQVSGDQIDMTLHGTQSFTNGHCVYTILAKASATLTGDALEGSLDYTPATNSDPDCTKSGIRGCVTKQSFDGWRPPK